MGGCAIGLLITDDAVGGIRPTKDIDVMPTDEAVLGFSNRWYRPAIASARRVRLGELTVKLIAPVYFVATKLEAFHGRGRGDHSASHDLEDLITVVDGRPELVDEVGRGAEDVRSYVAGELGTLLNTRAFVDALAGFLLLASERTGWRGPTVRRRDLSAPTRRGVSFSGH